MIDAQKVSWPGWETVKFIGKGSFGSVYEIQRDVLGHAEKAALKVISIPQNPDDIEELYNEGYDEESITSTFQSHLKSIVTEYALMRKMNGCSNIVSCDDIRYVQHDDRIGWDIYIKMELLTPLTKALPPSIPEQAVINLAKDLCSALELCKKHGIVHRDIKPQNIFVSDNGDYKLGDFGIAKTVEKTMSGTKIGTYKYMAPEVYNNQPYGSAADIYSLGLVLYWMLNGRRMPFLPLPPEKLSAGMDEHARARRLSGDPLPPPAHGSNALKSIVLKACAYNPKYRFQTPEEMRIALEAIGSAVHATAATFNAYPPQHNQWANVQNDYDAEEGTVGLWGPAQRPPAAAQHVPPANQQPVTPPAPKPVQPVAARPSPYPQSQNASGFPANGHNTNFQSPQCGQPVTPPQTATVVPQAKPAAISKGLFIFLTLFPYTGCFGIQDFYLGKKGKALLKLFTVNFLAFGWFYDIILIIIGRYRKKDGTYL